MRGLSERGQLWRERVRRQRDSGLSVAEFCEAEGVSAASFYQWRKRLAAVDEPATADAGPLFVPVAVRGDVNESIRLELPNGLLVHFPGAIAAERLADVVRAVSSSVTLAETRPC